MIYNIIMPIVTHSSNHCHRPMTEGESKTMLGVVVIIHALWVISGIISIIQYKSKKNIYKFSEVYVFEAWGPCGFFNLIFGILICIEILVALGYIVGHLF